LSGPAEYSLRLETCLPLGRATNILLVVKHDKSLFKRPALAMLAHRSPETASGSSMKLVAYLLGIILIVVAVIYFLVPADTLPGFFPGHEAGVTRVHVKHGIVSGIAGVVLLAVGWLIGRR
jgi:hypothetical protein